MDVYDNIEERRAIIVHLDCDAFYASVHELSDPSLVGKPVIVGGLGPRSIVTTASYAARKYGVHSAMSMERARSLCPKAIVIEPNRAAYVGVSTTVWEIVKAGVPVLEQVGIDEGYIDITEWENGDTPVLKRLRDLIDSVYQQTGITLSVGISPSKLLSKVLSDLDKPRGFVAMSRADALVQLGSRHPKMLPGIGPVTATQLDELGWDTLNRCAEESMASLQSQLGVSRGAWLYDACRLIGSATLDTDRVRKSISSEHTFTEDVPADDPYTLRMIIRQLAEEVQKTAREKGHIGRNVAVKIRTDDWKTYTRSQSFSDGVGLDGQLVEAAITVFDQHLPDKAVRLVGVKLGSFVTDEVVQGPQQLQLPLTIADS